MLGVFANTKYLGYITADNEDSDNRYHIYIYDMSGKLTAETDYNNSFPIYMQQMMNLSFRGNSTAVFII